MPHRKSLTSSAAMKTSRPTDSTEDKIKELIQEALKSHEKGYIEEINALKAEIIELKNSQQFLSAQYDQLKTNYDKLKATNKNQVTELHNLKSQSAAIEAHNSKEAEKLDAIEQYGRRQNLEIKGVPFHEGEDTKKIAIEVAKLLNTTLSPNDISTSHRLPARNGSSKSSKTSMSPKDDNPPSSIIVRFVNRDVRNRMYHNRQMTRNMDLNQFCVKGTQQIFINENLTHTRKQLFWKTKQKAKEAKFQFFWTNNGNIYVKKSEMTDPILIKNDGDLNLIK